MHINPDHFLATPAGRVCTPERNAEAWRLSFAALDEALQRRGASTVVYVLVGCQASGKSTWARERDAAEPSAIIFDAILVKRAERQPVLQRAAAHGVPVVAVWFQTPLALCLARNTQRPSDEIVPERGLRNVFAAVEPPALEEGFRNVLRVGAADAIEG